MFYPPNSSYALRTLRNVSASMQSYAHAQESQLQSLQLPSQLPQVRVSVRDNLLHLNRSCRRRRTRCPAHIRGHLHDLAHGSATLYHVIFWRYNKTNISAWRRSLFPRSKLMDLLKTRLEFPIHSLWPAAELLPQPSYMTSSCKSAIVIERIIRGVHLPLWKSKCTLRDGPNIL